MNLNIHEKIENILEESLLNIAKKFNYHESNLIILENNLELLKEKHNDIYNNLLSCRQQRDTRSELTYAKDLIANWILEDILLNKLIENGFELNLAGNDKDRIILSNNKISTTPDYELNKNDNIYKIELICSFTNYWEKYKKIDFRNDKFLKSKEKKAIILCLDFFNNKFFILDLRLNKKLNIKYIENHFVYKKPVYSIILDNKINFFDLKFSNIINYFQKLK